MRFGTRADEVHDGLAVEVEVGFVDEDGGVRRGSDDAQKIFAR